MATTTTTSTSTTAFESITSSIRQQWETAEALLSFCVCNQPRRSWEYATTTTTMAGEEPVVVEDYYPYHFNYNYENENPTTMRSIVDKLNCKQQQPKQQQQQQQHKQQQQKSEKEVDCCSSNNNGNNNNIIIFREGVVVGDIIRRSNSMDTCTTATMNSISFDAWDDDDEDDDEDDDMSITKEGDNDNDNEESVVVRMRSVPSLALSQQSFFSNDDLNRSFSFYASPALAYDESDGDESGDESDYDNDENNNNHDENMFTDNEYGYSNDIKNDDDSQWLKRANPL